jgi:diacylglycerol kinase family enzyme
LAGSASTTGAAPRDLAQQAAIDHRRIIVAGGDGTIGEALNGMARAEPEAVLGPIGILPLGTANDLVHNLRLPLKLEAAAAAIVAGRTRRIDLGRANDWVFANNSAIGLEPVVTQYNIRMVRLRGVLRYLVAALRAINDKPAWQMQLEWDDGNYQGPVSLVSVATGCDRRTVSDGAGRQPDDGRLTFVFGRAHPAKCWRSSAHHHRDFVDDPPFSNITTHRLLRQTNADPARRGGPRRSHPPGDVPRPAGPPRRVLSVKTRNPRTD